MDNDRYCECWQQYGGAIKCPKCHMLVKSIARGSYYGLSKSAGLSREHVSRVLRGLRGGSIKTVRNIATTANVDFELLVEYLEDLKAARAKQKIISKCVANQRRDK